MKVRFKFQQARLSLVLFLVLVCVDWASANAGGTNGGYHMRTWNKSNYVFYGVCDLILLSNPDFQNGQGMEIHIRTKKAKQMPYVSAAALRIGNDIIEVTGQKNENKYWINGVEHADTSLSPTHFAGYPITIQWANKEHKEYIIQLDHDEQVIFRTWNDFVRINVEHSTNDSQNFSGSVGLMGSFPNGIKLGRDKKTRMTDMVQFGQEWQVQAHEDKLFHSNKDAIIAPGKCEMAWKPTLRRQTRKTKKVPMKEAEFACSHLDKKQFSLCVFDVIGASNKEIALAY